MDACDQKGGRLRRIIQAPEEEGSPALPRKPASRQALVVDAMPRWNRTLAE